MKYIFPILILVFFIFSPVGSKAFAVATLPSNPVWITPAAATMGDEIQINTLVYNDTADQASLSVTFTADNTVVATVSNLIVASKTAVVATAAWVMPDQKTTITVMVTKALTKEKKEIPSLKGTIGTITIGGPDAATLPNIPNVKGFAGGVITTLEEFRLKQLEGFTVLYDQSKAVLGKTTLKDVSTILKPDAPAASSETTSAPQQGETSSGSHAMEYLKLIYATIGRAFFAQKTLYYIVIILAVLFVIRFIFRRLL